MGFKRFLDTKKTVALATLSGMIVANSSYAAGGITIPSVSSYNSTIEGVITMGLGALVFLAVGGILFKLVKKIA